METCIKSLKDSMIDTIKKMDSDVDVESIKNMNIKQLEFIIDYLKEYKYK